MKFSTFAKLTLFFVLISSILSVSNLRTETEIFSNSSANLKGPSKSKFKGKVSFDKDGRGILITSDIRSGKDKLLKQVSEKLSPDTYLIDYRLMRSCEFSVNFTGEKNKNVKIGFSPRSLENKSKNEKFEIKLEVLDWIAFFPKTEINEKAVQAQIRKQCEDRKGKVTNLKQDLLRLFKEYSENMEKDKKVLLKISNTKKNTNEFDANIQDIQSQIQAINSLQKSYESQKKNLQLLKKGSMKLIKKERKDLKEIQDKNGEIAAKLRENSEKLKKLNDHENDLKKNYEKFVLEQKAIEGEIINLNKKLSDTDQQISSLARTKLSDDYEIKYAKSTKQEIKSLIDEIRNQTSKFKKSQTEFQKKIGQINKSKETIEKNIKQNKEKIRTIDEQINELILKKTKIQEEVKQDYNSLKSKEDELSAIEIENQQISSNIKRLEDKLKANKNNLENIEEKHSYLAKVQKKYKSQLTDLNNTRHNITVQFHVHEVRKNEILRKIQNNSNLIEKNNNETANVTNVKYQLEKLLADHSIELKEKENNVKNLENEIKNYESDIENIDKTIVSFKENKQNIQKILGELNKKLLPYTEENKNLVQEKNQTEEKLNNERKTIRNAIASLKNNVPATKMIADIIEDEFSNAEEEFDQTRFVRLVQKIIS